MGSFPLIRPRLIVDSLLLTTFLPSMSVEGAVGRRFRKKREKGEGAKRVSFLFLNARCYASYLAREQTVKY